MARPKEFDRSEALERALMTFWRQGFEATSIPDLTESMGISRSSLYETFGDKESLFKEALRYYSDEMSPGAFEKLKSAPSAREGLRAYLKTRVADAMNAKSPGGCMYTYAAAQGEAVCDDVKAALKAQSMQTEKEIEALIRRGQAAGEIEESRDAGALARAFLLISYGVDVMARMYPCRARCDRAVETALTMLD